jgi:hypothetical protein
MRYNPGVAELHPGQVLVLPDRLENPTVSTGNQDFHLQPGFAEEINAMDMEESARQVAFSQAQMAERLSPNWGDQMYLGFDEAMTPFVTTDNQGIPLYYHGPTAEHPYSPDTSSTPARWGMFEAQPYVAAERRRLYGENPEILKATFDETVAFEDFIIQAEMIDEMREKDPQIYLKMLDNLNNPTEPIRVVEPVTRIQVRGQGGGARAQFTEEGMEQSGIAGDLMLWTDKFNWADEPVRFGLSNVTRYGREEEAFSIPTALFRFASYTAQTVGAGGQEF